MRVAIGWPHDRGEIYLTPPCGWPITLAIGWPHEGGEFPETRPHDRGDRHAVIQNSVREAAGHVRELK